MEKLDKLPSAPHILSDLASLSALPPSVKISLKNDRLALDAEKIVNKEEQELVVEHERFAGMETGHFQALRNHERILGQQVPADAQDSVLRLVEHLIQADGILAEEAKRLQGLSSEETELQQDLTALQQLGSTAL
jgi:hypothetical protein